jgi:hypothetical protein
MHASRLHANSTTSTHARVPPYIRSSGVTVELLTYIATSPAIDCFLAGCLVLPTYTQQAEWKDHAGLGLELHQTGSKCPVAVGG